MNFDQAIAQLQAAQGDPDKLALATLDIVLAGREPGLRAAFEAAALPHWFEADILAGLVGADEARRWLAPLTALPMVEAFPLRQGWNVHEATRLALRRHLAATDPARFRALSARWAEVFGGEEPARQIEALFHRLVAGPDAEAARQLRELRVDWYRKGRHENLQALAWALDEARRDAPLGSASRAEVLSDLIWIRGDNLPLPLREAYAQEALALTLSLDDGLARFEAHWTLGRVLLARRKLAEASAQYEAMAGIAQNRLGLEPENTAWLRRLSISHNLMGDLLAAQGDRAGALERHRASLAIAERLAGQDPANAEWQRDLAVSHNKIGDLLAAQGDRAGALERHRAAFAIAERLAGQDPANAQWQRDLSVSLERIGELLAAQGDRAGALERHQAAFAIRERLAGQDPANALWQRDLAVSHWKLAECAEQAGEPAEALACYRKSVALMEKLVGRDPGHAQWQNDLGWYRQQVRRLEAL
jgi:hypothetical protein